MNVFFSSGGMLSSRLKGYEQREEQLRMALTVVDAFNGDGVALIEAGTGTGKSLAYLVPSLLWAVRNRERVVVSTNTINLQEQLIRKDIPFLARHSSTGFKAVLVKGRSNYACRRKLESAEAEPSLFPDEASEEITAIIEWSRSAREGCRSTLDFTPHDASWEEIRCEADQCARGKCRHFGDCFFYRARRESAAADILVVNHSLLLSDIAVRQESGYDSTAILPPFSRLVIDEGHHLEEGATNHFSIMISRSALMRQLNRLIPQKGGRSGLLQIVSARIARDLPDSMDALYTELSALIETRLQPKCRDLEFLADQSFDRVSSALFAQVGEQHGKEQKLRITPDMTAGPFWKSCSGEMESLALALEDYTSGMRSLVRSMDAMPESLRERMADNLVDLAGIEQRLAALASGIRFFLRGYDGYCRWVEARKGSRGISSTMCAAPLDVAPLVHDSLIRKMKTLVVTSATLTAGGKFSYLKKRTGFDLMDSGRLSELYLPSPFDYGRQVLMAIPDDIPEPADRNFRQPLENAVLQAVAASRGGAFVLFTSFDLLVSVYGSTAGTMKGLGLVPMRQGEGGRHALLARFRKEAKGVLFGTDSFWEGVDVKGDGLRLVIITRLPFQVPTEPVQQARAERIKAGKGDPFREMSVPQAVIKFRQGFGRLIRSRYDRGAVLLLDRRVISKNYGKSFMRSLPEVEPLIAPIEAIRERMAEFFG